MKKWIVISLLVHCLTAGMSGQTQGLFRQEIRYSSEEAQEVYLVWGINNWQKPDSSTWPAGSYLKEGLLYTPMLKKKDFFSAVLSLPVNTVIDHVFLITKGLRGKPAEVWDTNLPPQKDYHHMVLQPSIIHTESSIQATPEKELSITDFAEVLLAVATLLLLLAATLRHYYRDRMVVPSLQAAMVVATLVLWGLMIMVRVTVTGSGWTFYRAPLESLGGALLAGYFDLLFLLAALLFFLFLAGVSRGKSAVHRSVGLFFSLFCLFTLVSAILNIRVIEVLGHPFNYQWLYYSDFLSGPDAAEAVSAQLSQDDVVRIICVCLFAIALTLLLLQLIALIKPGKTSYRLAGAVLTVLSGAYLGIGYAKFGSSTYDKDKHVNPLVAFAGSMDMFNRDPVLFDMPLPDSMYCCLNPGSGPQAGKANGSIKNVLIFVLESTPAEYVDVYGSKYGATPVLQKYAEHSFIFENIYAHAPATNNSMVSILGSVYPWLSYQSITREHPDVKIPTLSAELKAAGYRTAFFNSADNRFQKAAAFLSCRKFDRIADCNASSCNERFKVEDEHHDFLDGATDECTAKDLASWISEERDQPFFAVMWTYQTHYPYFFTGKSRDFSRDEVFNRYLNAVENSDRILGVLLEDLEKNRLLDSTLVIVVGDHGEAFGRHGQTTHASGIYEENLHVPCIFIHPSFKTERKSMVGGLIDIAPTVMSMLGRPSPADWHGQDLFAENRENRTYFFSPWSDQLFGYREGSVKYIYNATKGIKEIYDLEKDPYETCNLTYSVAGTEHHHMRLAGWVQALNNFMQKKLQ